MRTLILLLICFSSFNSSHAADSLIVEINKTSFKKADTIDFSCIIPNFEQHKLNAASLHVWIDNITTGTRWKFRYPFINGEAQAALVVGKDIPNGHYAINFLVQKGYFRMTGEVINHLKSESEINYMMIPKNKRTYFETISLNPNGQFRLKSTLFEDSAYFVFTPVKKNTKNTLHIGIETPLDSSFIPAMESRVWVTVGTTAARINKTDSSGYVFNMETTAGTDLLPGVTVVGKYKKKVEQYDEYYSSGMFQRPEALIFDGLEDENHGSLYEHSTFSGK